MEQPILPRLFSFLENHMPQNSIDSWKLVHAVNPEKIDVLSKNKSFNQNVWTVRLSRIGDNELRFLDSRELWRFLQTQQWDLKNLEVQLVESTKLISAMAHMLLKDAEQILGARTLVDVFKEYEQFSENILRAVNNATIKKTKKPLLKLVKTTHP